MYLISTIMEVNNNLKRKKRKTRRCLDELRKKTYQSNDVCKNNKNTGANPNKSKSNCIKSNFITNNRLTMLKKSVRSETVTRSQLCKIKDKNCYAKVNSALVQLKNKTVVENKQILKDRSKEELSPNINNNNVNVEINTPKSIILFSPESQKDEEIEKNVYKECSLEILQVTSSPSTFLDSTIPISVTDVVFNEIECYIKQELPYILKSMATTIKGMEAELSKLCFEEKSTSQTIYDIFSYPSPDKQYPIISSPVVPFIQNPRDYINYQMSQPQSSESTPTLNRIQVCSSAESDTSSSICTIATLSPKYISGGSVCQNETDDQYLQRTIHPNSCTPSCITSVVFDTPEYFYYPHRLN